MFAGATLHVNARAFRQPCCLTWEHSEYFCLLVLTPLLSRFSVCVCVYTFNNRRLKYFRSSPSSARTRVALHRADFSPLSPEFTSLCSLSRRKASEFFLLCTYSFDVCRMGSFEFAFQLPICHFHRSSPDNICPNQLVELSTFCSMRRTSKVAETKKRKIWCGFAWPKFKTTVPRPYNLGSRATI